MNMGEQWLKLHLEQGTKCEKSAAIYEDAL
jgi:hypothetical protein